jgi:hypothetical protein
MKYLNRFNEGMDPEDWNHIWFRVHKLDLEEIIKQLGMKNVWLKDPGEDLYPTVLDNLNKTVEMKNDILYDILEEIKDSCPDQYDITLKCLKPYGTNWGGQVDLNGEEKTTDRARFEFSWKSERVLSADNLDIMNKINETLTRLGVDYHKDTWFGESESFLTTDRLKVICVKFFLK